VQILLLVILGRRWWFICSDLGVCWGSADIELELVLISYVLNGERARLATVESHSSKLQFTCWADVISTLQHVDRSHTTLLNSPIPLAIVIVVDYAENNKKLSYCWETVRRASMPRIAEMDVEMTT